MSETPLSGGCLCGAVRYQVSGPLSHPCLCHCGSCRRASGAPLVAWGTFPRTHFRVTRGELAEYRSSAAVTRGFCRGCGTALVYRHAERAAEIDVTLASLDEPGQLAPLVHVWVGDKLPWVRICDDRPQYAAGTSGDSS